MRTPFFRLISILIGGTLTVGLCQLGYKIYDSVIEEDICAYHNQLVETTWLFDLFFPMSGWNGFHPEPGLVFYLTALACGIAAGVLTFRWMKRRRDSRAT